ncbi:MAG: HTTM domain-containing protein [Flavobacteriaceae bacterium]|nr:HTTM domain-containing protein [Flavobacteriaceae bacterium]
MMAFFKNIIGLKFINKLYDKRISSRGLGLFRIFFALNLFFEVLWIYRSKALYFDPVPFLEPSSVDYSTYLFLWLVVLFLMTLGFATRIMSILNYVLGVFILNAVGSFEYHMDYIYMAVSFIIIFIPTGCNLSIDTVLSRKYNWEKFFVFDRSLTKVRVLNYFLIVLSGIAMIYFDSILFKLKSQSWTGGLGLWLPASLPPATIFDHQWILNQEYFMKFFGYLVFAFEGIFPFVFFLKRFRLPLLILGILLHLGILIVFPIPYFALGVMSLYILMVPVSYWNVLDRFLSPNAESDQNEIGESSVFNGGVNWKLRGFKLLFVALIALQFNSSFNFPLSDSIVAYVKKEHPGFSDSIDGLKQKKKRVRLFTKHYLGITPHGVFVDGHFTNYDQYFNVSFDGNLLPMYNEKGMPDELLKGGSWANFNFRVNGTNVLTKKESLENGLMRFSSYWAQKNGIDLQDAIFEIVVKKLEASFTWEKDLLNRNAALPWEEVGTIQWKNNKAKVNINYQQIE